MQDLFEQLRETAAEQQPLAAAAMQQQPFVCFSPSSLERERRRGTAVGRRSSSSTREGRGGGRGGGRSSSSSNGQHFAVSVGVGSNEAETITAATTTGGRLSAEEEYVGEKSTFMKDYFAKVQVLKRALHEIAANIDRMRELQRDVLAATSPDAERDASHVLNKLLDGTSVMMQKATKALQRLREENEAFAAAEVLLQQQQKGGGSNGDGGGGTGGRSSEARIRQNMHQILARQLQQLLLDCQHAETACKATIKRRVVRQVQMVYPEASKEEVEELVEAGDLSVATAVKMRVAGTHQSLTNAVSDLQDKYRDILRLEQSVAELHQMFVELAVLVDQQGELLDQIEYNVVQAKDYTEKAEKELLQARKNQKAAKRRMCWLSVCVLVLIVIVLVPVMLTLLK